MQVQSAAEITASLWFPLWHFWFLYFVLLQKIISDKHKTLTWWRGGSLIQYNSGYIMFQIVSAALEQTMLWNSAPCAVTSVNSCYSSTSDGLHCMCVGDDGLSSSSGLKVTEVNCLKPPSTPRFNKSTWSAATDLLAFASYKIMLSFIWSRVCVTW